MSRISLLLSYPKHSITKIQRSGNFAACVQRREVDEGNGFLAYLV